MIHRLNSSGHCKCSAYLKLTSIIRYPALVWKWIERNPGKATWKIQNAIINTVLYVYYILNTHGYYDFN